MYTARDTACVIIGGFILTVILYTYTVRLCTDVDRTSRKRLDWVTRACWGSVQLPKSVLFRPVCGKLDKSIPAHNVIWSTRILCISTRRRCALHLSWMENKINSLTIDYNSKIKRGCPSYPYCSLCSLKYCSRGVLFITSHIIVWSTTRSPLHLEWLRNCLWKIINTRAV